ncbi:MAG: PKD domain-containing protein [Ferruginibacter sp.]
MKKLFAVLLFLFSFSQAFSSHIVGGEVAYIYLGPGSQANTSRYTLLLRLFTVCDQQCGQNTGVSCPPPSAVLGIFVNASPFNVVNYVTLPQVANPRINLSSYPACLDFKPTVCYVVNTYSAQVELSNNAAGYRIAYQSCCRAASINVSSTPNTTSGVPGATYEAVLPGTNTLPTGHNSTALVNLKDTALICYSSPFTLEFSAVDPDGDSLSYQFVSAYNGGSFTSVLNPNNNENPDNPLYGVVNYNSGYSGTSPLGSSVTINASTGVISGIAPANVGKYVVNVVIKEWRNGVMIAEHRKDFLIQTNACTLTKAILDIIPVTCDGFTVDFGQYNLTVGNITEYFWDFGDPASGVNNTSNLPRPVHTFTSAGVFRVKLRVSSSGTCIDSTFQDIKVYPGFFPDFTFAGQCKNTPIQFTDLTTATFGPPSKWTWNFGEAGSPTNTSTIQNPTHTYLASGSYDVTFIVETTRGCIDTLNKTIDIKDKPDLTVSNDTLICIIDTLQLHAVGTGSFVWSPNYMISNINSPDPFVSPDVTTTYTVTITDAFGCQGTDQVKVEVKPFVTLLAPPDTTICKTDPVLLRIQSDALYYLWTENPTGNTLNDPTIRNPIATPLVPTTYHVRASIGKCVAETDIRVTPIPYPVADAGPDKHICLGNSIQLLASGGSIYSWSPAAFLTATNIPNPVSVKPTDNVRYVVTVRDVLGCPKPVRDTMILYVDRINADAGPRDTSVVLGQPLQLGASGGTNYSWTPITWLNDANIKNPVSNPQNNIEYVVRVSNDIGCFDTDTILVKVYRLSPSFYVPNAFTPNGDGNNDLFRPIAIGMKSIDVFRVYNRWGQMVYSSSGNVTGWDGTFGGKPQEAATFVWYAEGVDYLNNKVKKKGTVILIR